MGLVQSLLRSLAPEDGIDVYKRQGLAVGLIKVEAVVAHDGALDGADAGLYDLSGEQIEDVHGLGRLLRLARTGRR